MKKELLNELSRNREIMGLLVEQASVGCTCNGVDIGTFPAGTDCSKKCEELAEKNCTGARTNPQTHRFYKRGSGKSGCIK